MIVTACFLGCLFVGLTSTSEGSSIKFTEQSINIDIVNRYAKTTYIHRFYNPSNDTKELAYQIELDSTAFISSFEALLNEKYFVGETKEAEEALDEYNDAVELGLNAILVSQDHDASVFTVACNLESNGIANINITSEMFIPRWFGWYELSFYISSLTSYLDGTDSILFNQTAITVNIFDEFGISDIDIPAPTNVDYQNSISYEYSSDNTNVLITVNALKELLAEPTLFIFRFQTETMLNNEQFLYNIDENNKELTFLHIFSHENYDSLPRRLIIVLDRSGSMGVTKWENAVNATIGALRRLSIDNGDRCGIVLFDSDTYTRGVFSATASNINSAISWLQGYSSGSSTNVYGGLMKGLDMMIEDSDQGGSYYKYAFVNQLVLITDGRGNVGYSDSETEYLVYKRNSELEVPASIFTLGIGSDTGTSWVSDINYPFLRAIARQNGGFDARMKESEMVSDLNDYYEILEYPVLSFIEFDYDSDEVYNVSETSFRGLYSGTDIFVVGKIGQDTYLNQDFTRVTISGNRSTEGRITVTTDLTWNISDTSKYVSTMSVNNETNYTTLSTTWGYIRLQYISDYLDRLNLSNETTKKYNDIALSIALEYELVTPWTSMIAVDYTEYVVDNSSWENEFDNDSDTSTTTSKPENGTGYTLDSMSSDDSVYLSGVINNYGGGGGNTGVSKDSLSPGYGWGIIAAIVIISLVIIAVILVICFCCQKRKRMKAMASTEINKSGGDGLEMKIEGETMQQCTTEMEKVTLKTDGGDETTAKGANDLTFRRIESHSIAQNNANNVANHATEKNDGDTCNYDAGDVDDDQVYQD